jgi:hypothetical protein
VQFPPPTEVHKIQTTVANINPQSSRSLFGYVTPQLLNQVYNLVDPKNEYRNSNIWISLHLWDGFFYKLGIGSTIPNMALRL